MLLHISNRIISRVIRGKTLATKLLTATTMSTTTTNQFFSSSAEKIIDGSNTNGDDIAHCDVVQGPSLLRTPAVRPHPSLLFLPGLRSLPFWTSETSPRRIAYNDPAVTKAVKYLESHVDIIREEYLRVSPSMLSDYDGLQDHVQTHSSSSGSDSGSGSGSGGSNRNSDSKDDKNDTNSSQLHEGKWDWYTYMSKGNIQGHFVLKFPETSRIINEGFRGMTNNYQLFEGTPFGFVFFSSLGPGAKIASHNAPTNLRLRIHLPIVVPSSSRSSSSSEKDNNDDDDDDSINNETGLPYCGIRVGTSIRSYYQNNNNNNALVLDDAFDHEVWNDTTNPPSTRVVLLVDIWHPDIKQIEKETIVDMFQTAKKAGLWKR